MANDFTTWRCPRIELYVSPLSRKCTNEMYKRRCRFFVLQTPCTDRCTRSQFVPTGKAPQGTSFFQEEGFFSKGGGSSLLRDWSRYCLDEGEKKSTKTKQNKGTSVGERAYGGIPQSFSRHGERHSSLMLMSRALDASSSSPSRAAAASATVRSRRDRCLQYRSSVGGRRNL